MKFPRTNRSRLGCLAAICFVLLGVGILLSQRLISARMAMETPHIVDVIVVAGQSRQKIELRDPNAIVVLQSLIAGGESVAAKPPIRPEFELFVHPTRRPTYSYSPTPVWQTNDGSFVWYHDGRVTKLHGSFTDFLEWLKIRRINQLLRDPDPAQRQLGEQLREASRREHTESLIRIANSNNGWFAQAGIREIADFIRREPAPVDHYIPGALRLPGRSAVVDPQRRVRDQLVQLVAKSPRAEHQNDAFGAGIMALTCLQQIGDRKTADDLIELMNPNLGNGWGDPLLTTIERLYGIPTTYERFGICGNSSTAELAQFAREEAGRQSVAMEDLLDWQREHAHDPDEAFYDAVVLRWSEMLIHLAQTPDSNSYQSDRTPAAELANLLGQGTMVVPALQRRQEAATESDEIAMLEFCIACLTGQCDAELVTELLAGSVLQQSLACCIIAATGDNAWDDQLASLLRTPLGDANVEQVVLLRDMAAQALYRSAGAKAVPRFRSALQAGFENQMMLQILNRLEVPVTNF